MRASDLDLTAALAPEDEPHRRSLDLHVPVAQGRESEGPVLTHILLVADPHEGHLEQPHDGRDHLLSRQPGLAQVTSNAPAKPTSRANLLASRTLCHRGW